MKISQLRVSIFLIFLCFSCTKNDLEITGRLVHSNGTVVTGQGVHLKSDNVLGKPHSKHLGEANTAGSGYFRIFAKSTNNGRYYLFATQGDGSLMQITESFSARKNDVTDVGDIIVSW